MNVSLRTLKERNFLRGGSGNYIILDEGIETSFRKLKYSIGLSKLHSKKSEYVEQKIYSRVIMYNFCESIPPHVSTHQKKYTYQVNFTMAVHICKAFLQKSSPTIPPHIETLLLRYLVPVKPAESSPVLKRGKVL